MLTSDIFRSKYSAYSISDHHETFLIICDKLQILEEMRIVEKLARPSSILQKSMLMDEVNSILKSIEQLMEEIEKLSALFKGKESAVVKEQSVTSTSWKNGVRRVQAKINNFYEEKMHFFDMVNIHMNL